MSHSVFLIPMLLFGFGNGDEPGGDGDQARIQGVFAITECQVGERKLDGYDYAIIEGDKLFMSFKGIRGNDPLIFRLDPTMVPRTIDFKSSTKDPHYLGIYEIDGDRLKIIYDAKARPTKFDASEGVLFILDRMKTKKPS